jgi:hypothetical protein
MSTDSQFDHYETVRDLSANGVHIEAKKQPSMVSWTIIFNEHLRSKIILAESYDAKKSMAMYERVTVCGQRKVVGR